MNLIETERTILRWFEKDDVDGILTVLGNPEVMRFSSVGLHTREQCEEFIDFCLSRYKEKGYGLFAVVEKESSRVIGYCGFYNLSIDGKDEVEIGYRLHPSVWNKGMGTEVASAVRDFGFNEMGFDRMISAIEAENIASIRVAEKNGMRHEKDSLFKEQIQVRIYSIEKQ
jgi:RimJ/RimL family protein N-acetyltransferase